jgi:parallel beta-helix repeat protein
MSPRHLPRRRWIGALIGGAIVCAVTVFTPTVVLAKEPGADGFTPEQEATQAALVVDEDKRLDEVRAIAAVAPLKGGPRWSAPYRLNTGSGYTLVLTQRGADYTIADLLQLAPQTFLRQKDGSYLLTENLYLTNGAKLLLSNPGGLTLRLASNANGFVSIVSFGGTLMLAGTSQAPLVISSFDPRTGQADTDVTDGRAYLRAIGGQFKMDYAKLDHLGFWSGRTGGLSLTGTDRPNIGALQGPQGVPKESVPGNGNVVAQPAGPLNTPDSRFGVPGLSYVTAAVRHSTITANVYGIFASSSTGLSISDTTVEESLADGVVLHRYVTNADISKVVSRRNRGDGFVLARATQQVRVSGCASEFNAGNGFSVNGQPLATGPSASGESTVTYGSSSISSSVARGNGHYGIEVVAGLDVGIQDNQIDGGDMGIVVRSGANNVAITGNTLTNQGRQGIAVRDGVSGARITGNVIENATVAVYVRGSTAEIRGNTIQHATKHGVTTVGNVDRSVISFNVIAGVGPSALDTQRAEGTVRIDHNQVNAWYDTSSFWVAFRHYASPMTLLWTSILVLIVFAAIRTPRRRAGQWRVSHPYAAQLPLALADPWDLAEAPPRPMQRGYGRAQVGAPSNGSSSYLASDDTQQLEQVG